MGHIRPDWKTILTPKERKIFGRLDGPGRLQDFINRIPINTGKDGDTCYSPRVVLAEKKAHCIEAAFLAAAVFWYHGQRPLVVDMRATPYDWDHVIAVFRRNGAYGAISKSNHVVLRYREPVYRTVRELIMSCFHEYTDEAGNKTLRDYSDPVDLSALGSWWITSEKGLWKVQRFCDRRPHHRLLTPAQARGLRKLDKIEKEAGKLRDFYPKEGCRY